VFLDIAKAYDTIDREAVQVTGPSTGLIGWLHLILRGATAGSGCGPVRRLDSQANNSRARIRDDRAKSDGHTKVTLPRLPYSGGIWSAPAARACQGEVGRSGDEIHRQ
jgi:hypothetical protein